MERSGGGNNELSKSLFKPLDKIPEIIIYPMYFLSKSKLEIHAYVRINDSIVSLAGLVQ